MDGVLFREARRNYCQLLGGAQLESKIALLNLGGALFSEAS